MNLNTTIALETSSSFDTTHTPRYAYNLLYPTGMRLGEMTILEAVRKLQEHQAQADSDFRQFEPSEADFTNRPILAKHLITKSSNGYSWVPVPPELINEALESLNNGH